MTSPVLKVKRGALANLPGLKVGEPALTTDTFDFFIGIDGTTGNNKFFGSHRYWTKETTTVGSSIKIVEGTNNGSNYIALKSPDSLAGDLTYVLPGTQGLTSTVLTNDGSGNLSWASGSNNASFSGITTFTDTTDSISYSDGSVQMRGGLGVTKSVNIGGNIYVSGVSTFNGIVVDDYGLSVTGFTTTTDLSVTNSGNFGGILGVDGTLEAHADFNVTGISTFSNTTDSTAYTNGAVVLDGGLGVAKSVNINNNLNVAGITTLSTLYVNGAATFTSTVTGTISTATRATTVDTTATSTNQDYYIPFVTNATSTTGETVRVDADVKYNPSTNTLTAPTIKSGAIKASDGTNSITITSGTGAVGFANSVTINGDLYVIGTTAQVETTNLKVQDSLIDLGLIQSGGVLVPPTSNLNIDIGVLFNWYNSSALKAAVYWDHTNKRVGIASDVTEVAGVLTANAYSDIEIQGLWVKDCAGESQVISCTASERFLNNITVDAGTF